MHAPKGFRKRDLYAKPQAVKRRSCGHMQPHAHCSAKADLHTPLLQQRAAARRHWVSCQHTRLRQRKGRTDEIGTANPLISNGFTPAKTSLVYSPKKPCLHHKEALFAVQVRLLFKLEEFIMSFYAQFLPDPTRPPTHLRGSTGQWADSTAHTTVGVRLQSSLSCGAPSVSLYIFPHSILFRQAVRLGKISFLPIVQSTGTALCCISVFACGSLGSRISTEKEQSQAATQQADADGLPFPPTAYRTPPFSVTKRQM